MSLLKSLVASKPKAVLTEADFIVFRGAKEGDNSLVEKGLAMHGRINATGIEGETRE